MTIVDLAYISGFLFGGTLIATILLTRPKDNSPITRKDIISDEALNAPLELSKNIKALVHELDKLKRI